MCRTHVPAAPDVQGAALTERASDPVVVQLVGNRSCEGVFVLFAFPAFAQHQNQILKKFEGDNVVAMFHAYCG